MASIHPSTQPFSQPPTPPPFVPLSWQTLLSLQDVDQQTRSTEEERRYRISLATTKQLWTSLNAFLLHDKFMYRHVFDQETRKFDVVIDPETLETPMHRFLANPYPYTLEPGIHHSLLWMWPKRLPSEEIKGIINEELPSSAWDVHWFENKEYRKSFKTFSHVHVFHKKVC